MAMTYSNELGWTVECLGPKSGHWKRKARATQSKDSKENASPCKFKKEGESNIKMESLIPLQELDLNTLELKHNKMF